MQLQTCLASADMTHRARPAVLASVCEPRRVRVISPPVCRFDVVVIDEAAQAVEPQTLVPMIMQDCKQVRVTRGPYTPTDLYSQLCQKDALGQSCG